MVNHELVYPRNEDGTLLTFEDSVILTDLMISYSNTQQGKEILGQIGNKFNLKLKPDFKIWRGSITKNCADCSGCFNGRCILGCMKTPGYNLCYWDMALEKIVGSGLVVHEVAHIWFDQAYVHEFKEDSKEFHEQSEKYAQYVENQFTSSLAFCLECQDFVIDLKQLSSTFNGFFTHPVIASLIIGVGFGVGSALVILIVGHLTNKKKDN